MRSKRLGAYLFKSDSNQFRSAGKGFTLVELMVVVVISALLVSGGLAAYNRYNERQIVVSAGKKLYNDIRFIQGKAAAGEKPAACQVAGTTLEGYQLFVVDSGTYTLDALCITEDPDVGDPIENLRTEALVGSITLEPVGGGTLFRVLSVGGEAAEFCLSGYDYLYRVGVTSVGEVSDDGLVDECP